MRNCQTQKILTALLLITILSSLTSAVSRSDLCIKQPVGQCSGNQLAELGSQDGDTSGKDFLFESSISSVSENGDITLQYKDSSSTGFSNVSTDPFSTRMGSSNDLFHNFTGIYTQDEGTTATITINKNEHNIDVDSVDLSTNDYQVTIDGGVSTNSGNIGNQVYDLFGENEYTQFLDAGEDDKIRNNTFLDTGQCGQFVHFSNTYEICLTDTTNGFTADFDINGTSKTKDEGELFTYDGKDFKLSSVGTDGSAAFYGVELIPNIKYGSPSDVTSPEGYNEYRLLWKGSSGNLAYSDSLFFSVDRGENLPFDKQVTVEGNTVQNPEVTSGITPGSGINVEVFQEESDPVNVSLVNAANDNTVATIKGNQTSEGAFYTIYNDLENQVLATFTDTSSEDVFTFPPAGDLMDSQSTQYDFYFEIMERDASQDTRTTKVYSVETSGTATNPAPVIHSVEVYNGSSWMPVENIGYDSLYKIRANITDSNNDFLDVDLQYNNDYDSSSELEGLSGTSSEVSFSKRDSGYYVWEGDRLENNTESGGYSLEINASDGSSHTIESRSWSYPFGEPELSYSSSSSVVENNFFTPEISLSCPQYECINQNETLKVYLDPVSAEVLS